MSSPCGGGRGPPALLLLEYVAVVARFLKKILPHERKCPSLDLAESLGHFFSTLPYENATKIVRHRRESRWERRLRSPAEVLSDHFSFGAGGTCFSLTWTLVAIMRELGFEAFPVLADRRGKPDSHCAVIFQAEGNQYLLDPGYLISTPVRLDPSGEVFRSRPLNDLRITPDGAGTRFHVATIDARGERHRYVLKAQPVGEKAFREPWAATFAGPSTRSLLLTRMAGDAQLYFHGRQLLTIRREGRTSRKVPAREIPAVLTALFGLSRTVIDEALAAVDGR